MNRFVAIVLGGMVFFLFAAQNAQAVSIVIDHTRTDITALSQAEIINAKANLHIGYGHTSHGSQIADGMTGLVSFANGHGKGLNLPNNIFAWNNGGAGGALDLEEGAGYDSGWLELDCGYSSWVPETKQYLNDASHADVNVIMWSWCGQAAGMDEQTMINNYLTPMSNLELQYPDVQFVYMTCHLDGTGADERLNQRNEQIREYCRTNDKILYDFADIESYDPDGLVNYMPLYADDACNYDSNGDGSRDKNWATAWQNSHTVGVDWYNCGAAHSESLNANQKAYAVWALFNDLATPIWEGPGGGNFSLASNWTTNSVPNGVGAIVRFSDGITAPSTITVDSPVTLGLVKLDSTQSYTLAGAGTITLQTSSGDAIVTVASGSHTIDLPVVLGSDAVIEGTGSLTLSQGISGNHSLSVLGTLYATSIEVDTLAIGTIAGASAAAVPEPSSVVLLCFGVFGAYACWRRKRA